MVNFELSAAGTFKFVLTIVIAQMTTGLKNSEVFLVSVAYSWISSLVMMQTEECQTVFPSMTSPLLDSCPNISGGFVASKLNAWNSFQVSVFFLKRLVCSVTEAVLVQCLFISPNKHEMQDLYLLKYFSEGSL